MLLRKQSIGPQLLRAKTKIEEKPEHLYDEQGRALNPLARAARLDIYREPVEQRRTAIICTIGPKTQTVEALLKLRRAGMDVLRMNFSHGSYEFHGQTIANLRKSFEVEPGSPVAIALDTKGPEIRTGVTKGDTEITIVAGSTVIITTDPAVKDACDETQIWVDYKNLPRVVKTGGNIFIDDGLLSLEVQKVDPEHVFVECRAVNTAKVGSKKGVNLPNVFVDLPAISEKDRRDLAWGVEQGVDMIFASFIRKRQDVLAVREALGEDGQHIRIISKIENHEGVQKFDEILEETDGVMVARGDLGIEIPAHKVFVAQKMMIARCNIVGKPVICATQMLESMTFNPRPTRAEVTDVANAVLDGADCVMLSGETAKGQYYEESVKMMHQICREAEASTHHEEFFRQLRDVTPSGLHTNENIAACAVAASLDEAISAIVVASLTGNSARLVAKYRPACPIIVATTARRTSQAIHLHRGCYPILYGEIYDNVGGFQKYLERLLAHTLAKAIERQLVKVGDHVVVVQGWEAGVGHTNTMRIVRVGG